MTNYTNRSRRTISQQFGLTDAPRGAKVRLVRRSNGRVEFIGTLADGTFGEAYYRPCAASGVSNAAIDTMQGLAAKMLHRDPKPGEIARLVAIMPEVLRLEIA